MTSPAARNQNAQRSPEETGPSLCCVDRFSHPWLRQFVQEKSSERGRCDYCGQEDAEVIGIATFHDPFENLVSLYVPSDDIHGDALIDLIEWEYGIFDEDLYLSEDAVALLEDIMAIGWDHHSGEPIVRAHDLYHSRSSVWSHTTMTESWQEFCDEVKENPNREPDFPVLMTEDIGRMVTVVPGGTLLYRARPGFLGEAHAIRPYQGKREIGPPEEPKPGRANAEGEVVLYVADQEETAIAETRPHRGLFVSVAEISPVRDLRLVDLSKSPPSSNPFTDEVPQYEREFGELLIAFGEELGKPLRRDDDPRDYVPCQKLARHIRNCGFYDGIRYPSAMRSNGTSIVLFDPDIVEVGPSKIVEVKELRLTYEEPEDTQTP